MCLLLWFAAPLSYEGSRVDFACDARVDPRIRQKFLNFAGTIAMYRGRGKIAGDYARESRRSGTSKVVPLASRTSPNHALFQLQQQRTPLSRADLHFRDCFISVGVTTLIRVTPRITCHIRGISNRDSTNRNSPRVSAESFNILWT